MARVLMVGTATLDLVFGLDHPPGADEEMRAGSLRTCRGGNAANSAVVLAGLGHATEFLGVLADAPETAVIAQDFQHAEVAFGRCPRLPGRPPTSSIYLSGACRSIVHYRDLPELAAADFMSLDFSDMDHVHFEGRNVQDVACMMRWLKARYPGLSLSLELEKPRPGIEALFGLADLLLCARGFAAHHGYADPDAFLDWLAGHAPAADMVLALGEAGASARARDGGRARAPACPPPCVADTLGAGDTFNAGLLHGWLSGWPLAAALDAACRLAGRKCGQSGFAGLAMP